MANLSDRVCIIGGGAAGVSAAMYLQKKGYENFEVYEKLWKVGGSIYSPKIFMNLKEYAFETGDITAKLNPEFLRDAEIFIGEKLTFRNEKLHFVDNTDKEIYPFDIKRAFSFKKFFRIKGLKKELIRLSNITNDIAADNQDLFISFSEFCKKYRLKKISDYLALSCMPFANGNIADIPAVFVINHINSTFDDISVSLSDEGLQTVFKKINSKLLHPVNVNSEVVKIQRPAIGTLGKIKVTVRYKGSERVEEFDKLIIAGDFDKYLAYADSREDEKEIFSVIKNLKLISFVAYFADDKSPKGSKCVFDNIEPGNSGHAFLILNNVDNPDQNYPATIYATADNELSFDENISSISNDIKNLGYKVKERLYEQEFECFPYIDKDNMTSGFYAGLDKIQGRHNTFYLGSIMDSVSSDGICTSSQNIIERFF